MSCLTAAVAVAVAVVFIVPQTKVPRPTAGELVDRDGFEADEIRYSWWECGVSLSVMEVTSYQRLRCHTGLEIGVRFSVAVWDIISVRILMTFFNHQEG